MPICESYKKEVSPVCTCSKEQSEDVSLSIPEKKIQTEHTHTTLLLLEALKFCRKNYGQDTVRTSALVGTIYYTHLYFLASRWRTPAEVYFYFRESILRQSVESPPTSKEIFEPEEAKDAVIFFYETYMRNLPLTSLLHLPHYKLHLQLNQDKPYNNQHVKEKKKNKTFESSNHNID